MVNPLTVLLFRTRQVPVLSDSFLQFMDIEIVAKISLPFLQGCASVAPP